MASETKHTPGPWAADRDNDVVTSDGTGIAAVHGEDADNEQANARLIAAAPDLYWALERVAHWNGKGDPTDLIRQARNAIAKAEAQS